MASRVARSLITRRRFSLSALSNTPHIPSEAAKKILSDVSTRRYFGSGCGVGINKVQGQMYSLASFNSRFSYQPTDKCRIARPIHSFYRSFASTSSSEPGGQKQTHVRVRIGSPITGYGQETRNRSARQRIPHRVWTDEDGVEHIEINFLVRGPQGNGRVFCQMFKDNVDKQWKYMYLVVDITNPTQKQLMLESFLPA